MPSNQALRPECPYCDRPTRVHRFGRFARNNDGSLQQRYRCTRCRRTFTLATGSPLWRLRRLDLCSIVIHEISSAKSQRRIAFQYQASRHTVARAVRRVADCIRLIGLAEKPHLTPEKILYFDEMETFIHARSKRISIMLAVSDRRHVLAFGFAEFPAVGKLGKKGLKKYGPRPDCRSEERRLFFRQLQSLAAHDCVLITDEHHAYPPLVRTYFPDATHLRFKAMRPRTGDYGELRQGGHDPLFTINHTIAMFKDNIKSLSKKTWCTFKTLRGLRDILTIYAYYHNNHLLAMK
ncbi:MAG TPA: hypothetical protein PLZ57_11495 [Pseudobdellovibrionaceae bacterium]|nr:hypothetical protein [Pseudobdellovibrionaceae bacterium]